MNIDDALGGMTVFGFVLFLLWMIVSAITLTMTNSECLRAGYPGASVDWQFNRYCVKRVDQTDVVVPLSQVRR